MIHVSNLIPRDDIVLGIIRGEGINIHAFTPNFERQLLQLITDRSQPLCGSDEQLRKAVRDMLRNGRYRPTGRGKPASEYLVRSALKHLDKDSSTPFPRINVPVDVCNYISLKYLIPISVWDLDLSGSDWYVFRLGYEEEQYVFNTGGQTIGLNDLVVGCRLLNETDVAGEPIVNPVKDSIATKTTMSTNRIAACIYGPLAEVTQERMTAICQEFATLIQENGDTVDVTHGIVLPGDLVSV